MHSRGLSRRERARVRVNVSPLPEGEGPGVRVFKFTQTPLAKQTAANGVQRMPTNSKSPRTLKHYSLSPWERAGVRARSIRNPQSAIRNPQTRRGFTLTELL